MTDRAEHLDPRALPIVWAALVLGCVVIAGAFSVLRATGRLDGGPLPAFLQWLAAPFVIGLIGVRAFLHRQVREVTGGRAAWWRANAAPILAVWALSEGVFLVGVVFWALTGGAALLVQCGVAFMVLLWDRPWRWVAERG